MHWPTTLSTIMRVTFIVLSRKSKSPHFNPKISISHLCDSQILAVYDSVGFCQDPLARIGAQNSLGGRDGVKGAVPWRSS
jgi:hypothetical protein